MTLLFTTIIGFLEVCHLGADFVELADNQAIVQYAFSSRCCDNPLAGPDAPKSWTVQGSHDGTNWFELASEQDDTVWGSETRIYVIDSPLNCRYIKLAVTDVGGTLC